MNRHIALISLVVLLAMPLARANVCRVNPDGVASDDGSTWALATTLQEALTGGNGKTCTEIWVAAGVYKPTSGTDRTISFNIPPSVAVYGGFAGNETMLAQRDPQANLSVLSGDIDGDDCGGSGCPNGVDTDFSQLVGANSYHVVVMDGTTAAGIVDAGTVLDGFTITAGDTNYTRNGAGLYCNAVSNGTECSPTLTDLTFSGNRANQGGAIYDEGGSSHGSGISSPTLVSVTFTGNNANFGAAMYNYAGGISSPVLNNVTFSDNVAGTAGGVMNNSNSEGTSNPTLINVTFNGNAGIAMINYNATNLSTSNPMLINVTISGNSGDDGGALLDDAHGGVCNPTLSNVIVWGDQASTGPEIDNLNGAVPSIDHSIIEGSGGSGSGWNSGLGSDHGGNLDADPLLGPLTDNGGPTQTMLPGGGGAAIDAGNNDNSVCPTADQRAVARPQDGNGDGIAVCDIGAVEFTIADDTIFENGFETTAIP